MSTTVPAIYENGVLRLLAPLELPDHTPVQVSVEVSSRVVVEDQRQQIRAALVAAGLSREQPPTPHYVAPLSPDERAALAQQISYGRPLSEIISEERDER